MNMIEGRPVKGPAEKLLFDADTGLLLRLGHGAQELNRGNVFVKGAPLGRGPGRSMG